MSKQTAISIVVGGIVAIVISTTIIVLASIVGLTAVDSVVYGQAQSNETTSEYGNMTKFEYADVLNDNMSNYLRQLNFFTDVCSDYTRLQVQEETDQCIKVVDEFNNQMMQLWNRHDVLDKNIIIAANSLDVEPALLPSPTLYCNSYEVYASLTEEQCKKGDE